jgi:hypothetical protein
MRSKESKMAFPISPEGHFHVPEYIVRENDGVFVAIDRDRANWICLNRSGMDILRMLPGKTVAEAASLCVAAGILPSEEPENVLLKFTADLARKEFLSTEPISGELVARAGILTPEKLHEVWIVTNFECNMSCRHCYTYERVANDRSRVGKDALLAMMDECRRLGTEVFYLTGGEPLLRRDLFDLIEGATHRSRAILFTNGTLVTPEWAKQLSRYSERLVVQVSLEGPDEESNAVLRGKESFDRAMEGIRNLLREGVRVGVSSTPTPQDPSLGGDIGREARRRLPPHHLRRACGQREGGRYGQTFRCRSHRCRHGVQGGHPAGKGGRSKNQAQDHERQDLRGDRIQRP